MTVADEIRQALRGVNDPELGRSLVDLEMVREIKVEADRATITLALTTLACPLKDRIAADAKEAVLAVTGIERVDVELVAMTASEKAKAWGKADVQEADEQAPLAKQFNRVGKVVAVMSGKGGVGKSLVTGLLAVALAREGKRVGILDADVTGPSIPKMFGLHTRPGATPLGILPVTTRLGIGVMSINLMLEHEDDAVIWRGPLIAGAIKQFWKEVFWGDLDYLFVDMPPGTSDVPLTVMQSLPVSGVVIVSSPQDLAGMVVRKAVGMARQMEVPVLGVVENMSYFACPDTGKRHEIFGASRGEELARAANAPLLGRLPLDPEVAKLCDLGLVEDYQADAYRELALAFAGLDREGATADAGG